MYSDDIIDKNSIAKNCNGFDSIPFRTYAEEFNFIKEDTISVVIDNCCETAELLSQLKYGGRNVRRKLQRHSVSLRLGGEFDNALKTGLIHDMGYGVYVLSNNDIYSKETGLNMNYQPNYIF